MKVKSFTGILTGILIMLLIFIAGGYIISFKSVALDETIETEYSPDFYYKYESECSYCGILVNLNNISGDKGNQIEDCLDTNGGKIFTGEVQLSDQCNYIYNYTDNDNTYFFDSAEYEEADINFIIRDGFAAADSTQAEKYLENLLIAYQICDSVYEYAGGIRLYVSYAHDVSDIYEISDMIASVSEAQVDNWGNIYYDIMLDESADIDSAKEIKEKLQNAEWSFDMRETDLIYEKISSDIRIIAEKPSSYNFDDWNTTSSQPSLEPTTTTETVLNPSTDDHDSTSTTVTTVEISTILTTRPPIHASEISTKPIDKPSSLNTPDINRDGIVNMADAVIISSILMGDTETGSDYINLADVNNDGTIDDLDYMTVCRNISGYVSNIKSVTVNLSSCSEGADCYVKIMSSTDLSDMTGQILLQKKIFGKYISIMTNNINAEGLYYIFNEKYSVDFNSRYRLVADILYNDRRIAVDDSCEITA